MNPQLHSPHVQRVQATYGVTKVGTPLDSVNMGRSMQSLLQKVKLPLHFTPHCLCQTYASILHADEVSPVYVQEQLGHATIEPTVSTYGRWLKKKAPGALDRLDGVVSVERSSKVVAEGTSPRNPQSGTNLQLPEIPWKVLEPRSRLNG